MNLPLRFEKQEQKHGYFYCNWVGRGNYWKKLCVSVVMHKETSDQPHQHNDLQPFVRN